MTIYVVFAEERDDRPYLIQAFASAARAEAFAQRRRTTLHKAGVKVWAATDADAWDITIRVEATDLVQS